MLKWLLACGIAALFLSGTSHAQLGQNLFLGNAKALALGNAVTADPPGVDAIHFNPAGLVKLKGATQYLKFILGDAGISADFIATDRPVFGDLTYEEAIALTGNEDPAMNSTSDIENFAIYLPGFGITEVPVVAAPLGGIAYNPPGSNLTFATAVYAPMLLGYTRADDDPGINYGRELGISRITYLSPTIGWQVTEELAVGAGIGFSYMGVGLDLDYRAANYFLSAGTTLANSYCQAIEGTDAVFSGMCVDDGSINPFDRIFRFQVELEQPFSPTFNFGVLWEPTPWFSWGLVYQSEAADHLRGDVSVQINPELISFIGGIVQDGGFLQAAFEALLPGVNQELFIDNGNIKRSGNIDLVIPQHLATGISVRIFPDLKINFDYKWTETSKWEYLDFRFGSPIETLGVLGFIEGVNGEGLTVPRKYKNATNWALGIEYQYNDQLALRFGYEPRDSGVPDDKRDFLIPLGDFDLYGLGAEYKPNPYETFDIAIGFGKIDEYIRTGDSTNGNDLRPDNFVYNPSAGQDVHFITQFLLIELSYTSDF
ncbi:MAG: aromatic hydrocarbon degradation protein [Gammaproteobacteria bacterium]|nr:MAG: aromatic hydrocarbon degradation protein [Gammaproteobacteria bacterium]